MPIIFKDEKFNGQVEFNEEMEQINEELSGYYCDGGVKDNLPISCLIKDEECCFNKEDRSQVFLRSTLYKSFAGRDMSEQLDKANRKDGEDYIVIT